MLKTNFSDPRLIQNQRDIAMEEYYGTTPNLEKGVKALEVICRKINGSSYTEAIRLDITNSKENKILIECFKKEFGFRTMNLFWDNGAVPNAFTVTGGLILDPNPGDLPYGQSRQKSKYYDNQHRYDCYVVVIMELVRKLQLTARETMAIILHEIGHNFDHLWISTFVNLLSIISTTGISELRKLLYKYGVIPINAAIQDASPILKRALTLINDLSFEIDFLPFNINELIQIALNPIGAIFGLAMTPKEYFADSMAKNYGFGADFATGTAKMGDPKKMNGVMKRGIYQTPILRTLMDLVATPCDFVVMIFDMHPFDENRMTAIRNDLKKDLADPEVPKQLKPRIKKEIEIIDKAIAEDEDNALNDQRFLAFLRKKIFNKINS